ncbi:MAG: protein-disulfide reductase DsbD, partial [Pseudomonadota bacterium]|nr:protein-disulfide reductase DsbD [Pseudomonadota bacterium]
AYTEQDEISDLLKGHAYFTIILSFFGIGFLLAFTPCVLPMYPILSGIIVGRSNLHTRKAFFLSLIYVISMSFTYAIGGMLAGYLGGSVQTLFQQPWIILIFSSTFIILALSFFGFYDIKLPTALETKLTNISNEQKRGSYIGVAIMGVLATLIVSPCVTPALVGALGYISESGDALLGGAALFSLGLGMGIPLIIIGTLGGKYMPKAGAWMEIVKDIFGVLMLAMAIWMLSRILPPAMTMLAWGALFIITAMFMGTFSPIDKNKWHKMRKGCGIIVLIYGILMIVGSGFGNSDPMVPLAGILDRKPVVATNNMSFKQVKNLTDVRRELAKSRGEGKFLLLDFYADWCTACKAMASNTFQDPEIIKLLKNFTLVQADVTKNDAIDKALENHFNVLAPPTIVFFGPQCTELKQYRVVGEMNAKKFKSLLEMMLHDKDLKSQLEANGGMNKGEICT